VQDARTRRGPHLPAALREVLENTNVIKCGVGIAKDLQKLADDEVTGELWTATGGVATAGFIDLGVLAWAHAIPAVGLKTLTAFFGHTLKKSKSISTSNWEARSLRGDQIYYAAQDAYAAVWILHQLHRFGALQLTTVPCLTTAQLNHTALSDLLNKSTHAAASPSVVSNSEVVCRRPSLENSKPYKYC
jgi:hypothetical protein